MAASIAVTYWAVETLSKQWSLAARLIHDHQLVTVGPYGWVRHLIYTGMLGMPLATGLVLSPLPVVMLSAAVYIFGTMLRLRVEERLLIGAFGEKYKQYSRKVPALIPRWSGGDRRQ